MNRVSFSIVYGCALSIALGALGCMGESDPESADDVVAGDESSEQEPVDEETVDPGLAAAIAEDKMAEVGVEDTLRHAACGTAGPFRDGSRTNDAASPNAARQRSGSSTGCTTLGVLQPTDDARYFCFTAGNDGFTWTYAQNLRTGVRGWTRDDLLRDRGSFVHCGF